MACKFGKQISACLSACKIVLLLQDIAHAYAIYQHARGRCVCYRIVTLRGSTSSRVTFSARSLARNTATTQRQRLPACSLRLSHLDAACTSWKFNRRGPLAYVRPRRSRWRRKDEGRRTGTRGWGGTKRQNEKGRNRERERERERSSSEMQ